jgi:hypothetical protein
MRPRPARQRQPAGAPRRMRPVRLICRSEARSHASATTGAATPHRGMVKGAATGSIAVAERRERPLESHDPAGGCRPAAARPPHSSPTTSRDSGRSLRFNRGSTTGRFRKRPGRSAPTGGRSQSSNAHRTAGSRRAGPGIGGGCRAKLCRPGGLRRFWVCHRTSLLVTGGRRCCCRRI